MQERRAPAASRNYYDVSFGEMDEVNPTYLVGVSVVTWRAGPPVRPDKGAVRPERGIIPSPDGTKYRLTVANSGALSAVAV